MDVTGLAAAIAALGDADHALLRTALRSRNVKAPAGDATLGAAFASKEARKVGKGFPCTATPACSRKDLRTANGASSHEQSTEHGWHKAA